MTTIKNNSLCTFATTMVYLPNAFCFLEKNIPEEKGQNIKKNAPYSTAVS